MMEVEEIGTAPATLATNKNGDIFARNVFSCWSERLFVPDEVPLMLTQKYRNTGF